jgi:hypothetical protein
MAAWVSGTLAWAVPSLYVLSIGMIVCFFIIMKANIYYLLEPVLGLDGLANEVNGEDYPVTSSAVDRAKGVVSQSGGQLMKLAFVGILEGKPTIIWRRVLLAGVILVFLLLLAFIYAWIFGPLALAFPSLYVSCIWAVGSFYLLLKMELDCQMEIVPHLDSSGKERHGEKHAIISSSVELDRGVDLHLSSRSRRCVFVETRGGRPAVVWSKVLQTGAGLLALLSFAFMAALVSKPVASAMIPTMIVSCAFIFVYIYSLIEIELLYLSMLVPRFGTEGRKRGRGPLI